MKKVTAILLSMLMLLSVVVPFTAFAEGEETASVSHPTGATEAECIANAVEGRDYEISADTLTYTVKSADGYMKVVNLLNQRITANEFYQGKGVHPTLVLDTDICFDGLEITSIGSQRFYHWDDFVFQMDGFTFDGKGHTLSEFGLEHTKEEGHNANDYAYGLIRFLYNGTVKDLTLEHAWLHDGDVCGAGMVAGFIKGDCTFENVHVRDCSMWVLAEAGGIIGIDTYYDGIRSVANLTMRNCSVEKVLVFGSFHLGGVAGVLRYAGNNNIENVTAHDVWLIASRTSAKYFDVTLGAHANAGGYPCLGEGANITGYFYKRSNYYYAHNALFWNLMGDTRHDCGPVDGTMYDPLYEETVDFHNDNGLANGESVVGPTKDWTRDYDESVFYKNLNIKSGSTFRVRFLPAHITETYNDGEIYVSEFETPSTCATQGHKTYSYKEEEPDKLYIDGDFEHPVTLADTLLPLDPDNHIGEEKSAENAVPSTCVTHGHESDVLCTGCDALLRAGDELPLDPDNHEGECVTVGAKAPTCTEEGAIGTTAWSCCGKVEAESAAIPALGHEWGEWTVTTPVSYGVDGEEERVCAVCGEKETRVISVANMTGRKIQFTKMDDMYYVVHMGSHDRWILKEDTRAFDWYDEVELNFEVRLGLGWRLSDYSYKTYVIYLNNKPLEPNEDGTYTIPANIGRAVVTITGASEPTADETPTQFEGKISFWEKIVNFFKMIAETLKNLFK